MNTRFFMSILLFVARFQKRVTHYNTSTTIPYKGLGMFVNKCCVGNEHFMLKLLNNSDIIILQSVNVW